MRVRLLALPFLLLALLVAGCSQPAESSNGAVLGALAVIEGAGFHDMNEVLTGSNPRIDPAWVGATQHAQIAAAAIKWPKDIQPKADEFVKTSKALLDVLQRDDAKGAAKVSTDNHGAYHALTEAAWAALGGSASGGSDHTH